MHLKKMILPLVFSGLSLGALYAYREYHRSNKDISHIRPDYQLQDTMLINAFLSNEQIAAKEFIGRVVAVRGIVRDIEFDKPGNSSVVLGRGSAGPSVTCVLDSNYVTLGKNIRKGDTATLKGVVIGFNKDETGLLGSDVQLVRCIQQF